MFIQLIKDKKWSHKNLLTAYDVKKIYLKKTQDKNTALYAATTRNAKMINYVNKTEINNENRSRNTPKIR
jgi:hypothetical protein